MVESLFFSFLSFFLHFFTLQREDVGVVLVCYDEDYDDDDCYDDDYDYDYDTTTITLHLKELGAQGL